MGSEGKKFGRGPTELTGAVDLINSFKLLPHNEYFCKRSLPLSISDTHYLQNVVGDTQIRKGEGMQLDQLIPGTSCPQDPGVHIHTFDLRVLSDVFQLKEAAPFDLPHGEKGIPAIAGKAKIESKEKRHKKHNDREKDRERKKHKHRHRDRSKDKDKEKKERSGLHDSAVDSEKHSEKKRKHDGDEDINTIHKQKKSKSKC